MTSIAQQQCIPCSGNSVALEQPEIDELLAQVSEWSVVNEKGEYRIQRVFSFPDFQSAMSFTQRVGDAAERAGHHPSLLTEWGKVTVTWWTHAIGGLHTNDFIMAARTDRLAQHSN